jgi:hypothetical protein
MMCDNVPGRKRLASRNSSVQEKDKFQPGIQYKTGLKGDNRNVLQFF